MFVLYANKSKLSVKEREAVASGSVNVCTARFEFSPDWDGMERTAVFQAGRERRAVPLDGAGECTLPWEVLEKPGLPLLAGVYGVRDGAEVLPTVWAGLGTILEGVPGDNPGAEPPTPDLWKQELGRKGDALGYTEEGELGLYAGEKLLSRVELSGGGTPAQGDGVPVGTVISYLGLTAPEGFLACDGGAYPIARYGKLAALFKAQFGAANIFGGDGEATFAVPDMRNLFLRGYHGEAEALSGEVGLRQAGTVHTAVHAMQAENGNYALWSAPRGRLSGTLSMGTENADTEGAQAEALCAGAALVGQGRETSAAAYTSRPVNMADRKSVV